MFDGGNDNEDTVDVKADKNVSNAIDDIIISSEPNSATDIVVNTKQETKIEATDQDADVDFKPLQPVIGGGRPSLAKKNKEEV